MTKSLSPATRAGQSLSEDLIYEIVLRLPVKIILRCKAVSKGWKTLISSPDFIKSHLRHTIASPAGADKTLIIVRNFEFSLFDVNSGKFVAYLNLPDHFKSEFPYTFLVGSACGIVCVCCSLYKYGITHLRIDRPYLWNPATKQSIRIPPPTIDVENKFWLIGFGFDHLSSDFKFLRMMLSPFSAEVYSTNRNCWKKVEQVENYVVPLSKYSDIFVCVKGSYLCCARTSHMIAFDLNKEVLNCAIELPVRSFAARITEFNDSVAVINWVQMDRKFNIKLWKLVDETCISVGGVEASWTLMLSIDHWCKDCVHVYLNRGDFLLSLGDDSWCFCNEKNKERLQLTYHYPVPIFKYMESLVSFTGSKLVDWNTTQR